MSENSEHRAPWNPSVISFAVFVVGLLALFIAGWEQVEKFAKDVQQRYGLAWWIVAVSLLGIALVAAWWFGTRLRVAGIRAGREEGRAAASDAHAADAKRQRLWYDEQPERLVLARVTNGAISLKWGPSPLRDGGVRALLAAEIVNLSPFRINVLIESMEFIEVNSAFTIRCGVSGAHTQDVDRGATATASEWCNIVPQERDRIAPLLTVLREQHEPGGGQRVLGSRLAFWGAMIVRVRVGEPSSASTRQVALRCDTVAVVEVVPA